MNRILFTIFGLAVLLCCSCSKEEETSVNNEQNLETTDARGHMVFYSTTSSGAKVGMVSRTQQGFQKTDTAAIFEASAKRSLYTVDAAGSTPAAGSSLYSSAKLIYYSGDDLDTGTTHYAVLPAKGATWSGSNLSVVQSAKQYATPGSQDSTGCIHYGKTTTNNINFKNFSAMFRLVVVGENTKCDEIRLEATNIAGTATITLSSGTISAGNANSISCKAVGNGKFAKDTNYYYGFLPGTYSSLTVTAYNGGTAIEGSTVTYSGKTWSSGAVYNIYLRGGKLYSKKSSVPVAVDGCLPGEFSVASGKTVKFSMGNLQYQASTGTWRFAEHQWDYIGSPAQAGSNGNSSPNGTVSGSDNANISSSYTGWIDLFGWGTSGWDGGATCYQPYSTSETSSDYYPGGSADNNLTGSCANADWGVNNAIKNGGNTAGQWRTLTMLEWYYLLKERTNASSRYGHAKITKVDGTIDVEGLIVLPDVWSKPDGVNFTSGNSAYANSYTTEQWALMEAAGAVMLPAGGSRYGSTVGNVGAYGGAYWSSTVNAEKKPGVQRFGSNYINDPVYDYRYVGYSVRLVQ